MVFNGKRKTPEPSADEKALRFIQKKFIHFKDILECNNRVLKLTSELEERARGEELFDINYLRNTVKYIQRNIEEIIRNMTAFNEKKFEPLWLIYRHISRDIEEIISHKDDTAEDVLTVDYADLDISKRLLVGCKNAQLAIMKNQLKLPAPDGFAITAWAYRSFIEYNDLQNVITQAIKNLDINNLAEIEEVSNYIVKRIKRSPVPEELSESILKSYKELVKRTGQPYVSVRSSARGEDTKLSFAGQYLTVLNVNEDTLIESYLDVIASKFMPKAIYYFLSNSLSETDLAMSVGCVQMINSKASGVLYTRDPIRPDEYTVVINAIYGYGQLLVDGTCPPDIYYVSHADFSIVRQIISKKHFKLVIDEKNQLTRAAVPNPQQDMPAITRRQVSELCEIALQLEKHYGEPQNVEWTIDPEDKIFILQSRPLKVMKEGNRKQTTDVSKLKVLISGGETICPGGGVGKVHRIKTKSDLNNVPEDVVIVANNPYPGLITALTKATALIARVGSMASHLATIAREYRIPTVFGNNEIEKLIEGTIVTVDANNKIVYDGAHYDLAESLKPDYNPLGHDPVFILVNNLLSKIAPLNLLNVYDDNFTLQNCRTFHDMTRYCHQMAIDEMFKDFDQINLEKKYGISLRSTIPIELDIIYIDEEISKNKNKAFITDEEIESQPMKAFWSGMLHEGWPAPPPKTKKFKAVSVARIEQDGNSKTFGKKSFAILSKEFMLLNLKLGYHFTSVEAMCSNVQSNNYVKMQFKQGGASQERRIRRIKLITNVLENFGFDNYSRGDFLDTMISYETKEETLHKLKILGRLLMLTKQLDMALSSDPVAEWYTKDITRKLLPS